MTDRYRVVGSLGSPYTMKMRALFRYRHLPHVFELRDDAVTAETAEVRPQIVPMVLYPGEAHWRVDSTPIAMELEQRHPGERSVLPDDAGQRFLALLIEDFADEWLTKCMFHYRWFYAADRDYAAGWIAADRLDAVRNDRHARRAFAEAIGERQVGRMALVGCTEANRPIIERTYERVLDCLEPDVGYRRYLFGSRPSIADFGLFGQLKTLADDPTGQAVMRQRAPRVSHWVRQIDDLSGLRGEWAAPGSPMLPALATLLELAGQTYLPFLAANAAALEDGTDEVRLDYAEGTYTQAPFRYQAKCLGRLRSLYQALTDSQRSAVDALAPDAPPGRWLA